MPTKKKPVGKAKPEKVLIKKKPAPKAEYQEMVKLSSLKPNKQNPRSIRSEAFQVLKDSIKRDPELLEFRPLVIDAERMILGGNQRFRALKELGFQEIPARWVADGSKLTPAQRRRFILLDNSPKGMSGEFDYEILANEWELDELLGLGFSNVDLGIDIKDSPDDFKDVDESLETGHECPKCGYKWS